MRSNVFDLVLESVFHLFIRGSIPWGIVWSSVPGFVPPSPEAARPSRCRESGADLSERNVAVYQLLPAQPRQLVDAADHCRRAAVRRLQGARRSPTR